MSTTSKRRPTEEDLARYEDISQNPEPHPGFVVEIFYSPTCDICEVEPAHFDFKMAVGPWAYGCKPCYLDNRMFTSLGVGKGQRLVRRSQ